MKNTIKRPQTLSTCLAVAKRVVDSFCKKTVNTVWLRKSTQKRIIHYSKQMECSPEELLEALAEYFVHVQMTSLEQSPKMYVGGGREIYVEKFVEEPQKGLSDFF
ncbi:hypothetical protein FCL47_23525 [Desulfopila sp. IMCC35006]|uniref:hypothetical protein n=1 Tax=Desulfopila sp. IMCC35006 TaxID=2569542 RepID=UPI0010ACE0B6|nr:hypothetical protein [Desulfopila sp. IMCC35006]TKB23186.1 hypothetical protein FCL47_23525 [Desulfopila sp. IMCC35006]